MLSVKKPRRIIFWKVSGILLMFLTIEGGVVGAALYLNHRLHGDANAINYAGQERYRSYQLAYLINRYAEEGANGGASRELIEAKMNEFEKILYGLRDGDKALGLKGVKRPGKTAGIETAAIKKGAGPLERRPYPEKEVPTIARAGERAIWLSLTHNINEWEGFIKPALTQALNMHNAGEAEAVISEYNEFLPHFVSEINYTVTLFSEESAGKVAGFQIFLFISIGIVVGIIGVGHFLAWAFLERPLLDVYHGMQAIINGDLKQKIPIRTNDEIGELASSFNVMAEGLEKEIAERKQAEERIRQMAHHDTLTGLPNRLLFNDRLTVSIAHARRYKGMLAVLFLDLDRFKDVNDTLGHTVGDQLLKAVAERLAGCVRGEDTVARLGGDEFTLILAGIAHERNVTEIAGKILETVRQPLVIGGHKLNITTSIGIALYPNHGKDAETLMKNSDIAMYKAKETGRNNYQLYTAALRP